MRLKQAQELELARSIAEIEHVLSARVHLALPEREVFIRQEAQPSASVFVQLSKGRILGRSQVEAIIHLVSSSVPKLAKENNHTIAGRHRHWLKRPTVGRQPLWPLQAIFL